MGHKREQCRSHAEDGMLLDHGGDDRQSDDRGDRGQHRAADEQQSESPAHQPDDRERRRDADVPAERGRRSFPTPEAREHWVDLPDDRGQGSDITEQRATQDQTGEATSSALQQVGDEDRDARRGPDRERDIRRSRVARAHRPGVRSTSQPGGNDRARNASNEVANPCSQSSKNDLQ